MIQVYRFPHLIRFFSRSINKQLDHSKVPKLIEEDLEENFVLGSGPGGQSVQKTANCVVLKHKPTNIVVKCHETRSLDQNRREARKLLIAKLDEHFNKDDSINKQRERLERIKYLKAQSKSEKLRKIKMEFKKQQEENKNQKE
ncbi:CLUMA_CG009051, isoform A [Clunio marinus]|uniref:CLUMA_CG009051, isoform A n=1 Tax=Clunio marinus TaxID=568069 RepID=A0A1J1I5P0_9DIPT|nr:CLUMA_CG009051, isoform A [Clunio marinus]